MRVYLPGTISLLARLKADGALTVPAGYAVTGALRAWYQDGDEEELEYAALTAAARASLRELAAPATTGPNNTAPENTAPEKTAARRVVIAADVPDSRVRPLDDEDGEPGVIKLTGAVRLADIAALHVDDAEARDAVLAAAAALEAADRGDADASFTVDAVEDFDLLWYAAQELGDLV